MKSEDLNLESDPAVLALLEEGRRAAARSRQRKSKPKPVEQQARPGSPVVLGESQEAYDALYASYLEEFEPRGPVEFHEIETMVNCQWRIQRFQRAEAATITNRVRDDCQTTSADAKIGRSYALDVCHSFLVKTAYLYEPRLQRDYERALRRILDLKKRRSAVKHSPGRSEPLEPPLTTPFETINEKSTNEPTELAPAAPPTATIDEKCPGEARRSATPEAPAQLACSPRNPEIPTTSPQLIPDPAGRIFLASRR